MAARGGWLWPVPLCLGLSGLPAWQAQGRAASLTSGHNGGYSSSRRTPAVTVVG